eukprot:CAMPEP_0172211352 /NCGR_PEP_ID=MMETSP1050-20130122/36359_1 /TAXON_ID=233186 /ORGANISM="Cryptomonas curvata, Strain CCAP979/52" /LENGTH=147 /DNA_ID=CAMNT_0012891803 /DNA_START=144 /DNA_END=588 /DNA_ORIENTATION=+
MPSGNAVRKLIYSELQERRNGNDNGQNFSGGSPHGSSLSVVLHQTSKAVSFGTLMAGRARTPLQSAGAVYGAGETDDGSAGSAIGPVTARRASLHGDTASWNGDGDTHVPHVNGIAWFRALAVPQAQEVLLQADLLSIRPSDKFGGP